jgi:hypothetical protein
MLAPLKPSDERVSRLTSAATNASVLDHATSEIASGSKLGIDATKKLLGEGFKRPWPPLIKMDKQVQEKITALFGGKNLIPESPIRKFAQDLSTRMKPARSKAAKPALRQSYPLLLRNVVALLDEARHASARTVNVIMTATYWQVGRHIIEFEQAGERRAGYGQRLLDKLSADLNKRFGRSFSVDHLEFMRLFYTSYSPAQISETVSRKLLPVAADISESPIRKSSAPPRPHEFRISDSEIHLPGMGTSLSALLDALRSPVAPLPFARGPRLLRNRSLARRLVRAPVGPPDVHALLRTHCPLAQQSRHAPQRRAPAPIRPRHA